MTGGIWSVGRSTLIGAFRWQRFVTVTRDCGHDVRDLRCASRISNKEWAGFSEFKRDKLEILDLFLCFESSGKKRVMGVVCALISAFY